METIDRYRVVYQMLEDEESRFTWLNRLNYLISDDIKFINEIVDRYLPGLPQLGSRTAEDILSEMPKDKSFVLFGAGMRGVEVLPFFQNDNRFIGFCSSTKEKQKNGFKGYPVISPEELFLRRDLSVVVSASSSVGTEEEILEMLKNENYPTGQIFTLTGMQIGYNEQYFGPDFITYEDEEVFVDAGSFNLRTAVNLRKYCKKVKKVYAFEPDPENYDICLRNKEKYHFYEADILPFGTWDKKETLHFKAGNLAVSFVDEDGDTSIDVTTIDEIAVPGDPVTFIKMDIEGSELESLKGAKQLSSVISLNLQSVFITSRKI